MRVIPCVDHNGYFIEDILLDTPGMTATIVEHDNGTLISTPVPPGLYQPRWDFDQATWTEGMPAQDIAALQPVASETPEQKIARLEQSDLDNKELIASLYEMLIAQGGQ